MKNHTSFKTGGPADVLVVPDTAAELSAVAADCRALGFPHMVIGNGSNLLFPDEGYRGVVIKTTGLNECAVGAGPARPSDDAVIIAGAGVSMAALADKALEAGLTGFEFASGIPGTLGGGVYMNAGAYGGEIKDVFLWADVLTGDGITRLSAEDMQFGYRHSIIQDNGAVLLRACIALTRGVYEDIQAKMLDFGQRRRNTQPLEHPSAGSTFKRPEGHFVGTMIREAGLAGFTIGGAQVSEKHCGFVINKDGATSKDILDLIGHVQGVIMEKNGVWLEPEVRIVN
ncbi:MAG: UDP-N-acetylmuramate dehydrogenase [Defluviitaleaceae bacterium]|nr:UDP-N-acetylmuramate dehydrogenase [Defluviitaleaceae bacterium]